MKIKANKANIRIDIYLKDELNISRSKIQKLIKEEKILVNNKIENANYIINENDEIEILSNLDFGIHLTSSNTNIEILYENDDLLIINKPSGMVTHPAPGNYENTLVNALIGKYNLPENKERPGIVHRLDKDTSGLMVVAKNDYSLEKLSDMMSRHEVKRTYIALVEGIITNDSGTINAPIGRSKKNRLKMEVTDEDAKDAITHFEVLKRYNHHTLIKLNLETGRTHQIRVHMSYINHPVANDPLYSDKIYDKEYGQLLHSTRIIFNNPRDGKLIDIKLDPSEEFNEILNKIVSR